MGDCCKEEFPWEREEDKKEKIKDKDNQSSNRK